MTSFAEFKRDHPEVQISLTLVGDRVHAAGYGRYQAMVAISDEVSWDSAGVIRGA